MPRVASFETVTPTALSSSERGALADRLYEAVGEIFDTDKTTATRLLLESPAQLSRILLFKDEGGRVVGLFALHFFERQIGDRAVTVVRGQGGLLRAYRGRRLDLMWAVEQVARYTLAHPGRELYGLGLLIHPSGYLYIDRFTDFYWPKHDEPVPPELLPLLLELADSFQLQVVDPARPLVRRSTFRTRETEAERAYWWRHDNPAARFFVSMNPNYGDRQGLLVLGKLSPPVLATVAARFVRDRAGRLLDGALLSAQRLPLGGRLLRAAEVRRRLRGHRLLAALAAAELEALARDAEIVSLSTGAYLPREGDEGSDAFFVVRGVVSALASSPGGEVMVGQFGAGALVGEAPALTGGRRPASIRAATPSVLVRIRGAALAALMASNASLRDAVRSAASSAHASHPPQAPPV